MEKECLMGLSKELIIALKQSREFLLVMIILIILEIDLCILLIKMNCLYNYLDLKNKLMKVCYLFYINAVNIIKVLFVQKIKEAMLIRSNI